jgi:hypothetical protein
MRLIKMMLTFNGIICKQVFLKHLLVKNKFMKI